MKDPAITVVCLLHGFDPEDYRKDEYLGAGDFAIVNRYSRHRRNVSDAGGCRPEVPESVACKRITLISGEEKEQHIQLGKLRHQNIRQIFCCQIVSDKLYLYMELYDQNFMRFIMQDDTTLDWPDVKILARQMIEGCAYLHSRGVVHRNITPQNVMVLKDVVPCMAVLKLANAGLARATPQSISSIFEISEAKTCLYKAPELFRAFEKSGASTKYTYAGDIFALGVVIYHMIKKRRPFTLADLLQKSFDGKTVLTNNVGHVKTSEALSRMLEWDPVKRSDAIGLVDYFSLDKEEETILTSQVDVNRANKNGALPLHFVSQTGNAVFVKLLLENKKDINVDKGKDEHTPLHAAALRGHAEVVKVLLDHKADPNKCRTTDGSSPLYIASLNGHPETAKLLLESGADPNHANPGSGYTPLYVASKGNHVIIVRLLLGKGVNIDLAVSDGGTALYTSSRNGHTEVVRLLLQNGADTEAALHHSGSTPIYVASERGHDEVVRLLLKHEADVDSAKTNGKTALYAASKHGHDKIVKRLLKRNPDASREAGNGETALSAASNNGHDKVVELLLMSMDVVGGAPKGVDRLFAAVQNGRVEIVQLLLQNQMDVNRVRQGDGFTPLHLAVFNDNLAIVKQLLVVNGIEVNAIDRDGNTPMHLATGKQIEIIRELLKRGADFCVIKNSQEKTPLTSSHKAKEGIVAGLQMWLQNNKTEVNKVARDEALLEAFVKSYDDEVLKIVLKSIADDCTFKDEWILTGNGKKTLLLIVAKRRADINVLKESYDVLLRLLTVAKKLDSSNIQNYCYQNFEEKVRLNICNDAIDLLPQELDSTFLLKRACTSATLLFVFYSMFDFLSDVSLTASYWNWPEAMSNYSVNASVCDQGKSNTNALPIGCSIYMQGKLPFCYSLAILLLPFFCQIFVLLRTSAKQYLAEMSGHCCWKCCKEEKVKVIPGGFFAFILQPIATEVWSFICKERYILQLQEKADGHDLKYKGTMRHEKDCLKYEKKKSVEIMKDMEDLHLNADFIHSKTMTIIACTENTLMPILQLNILFPVLLDRINDLRDWMFYFTLASITSSVFGLAMTQTRLYFSKVSKVEQYTIKNILPYFASVLLQCISRLFAFQVMSFALSQHLNGNIIIIWTVAIIIQVIVIWLTLSFYYLHRRLWKKQPYIRHAKETNTAVGILIFNLNIAFRSIYTFTEVRFDEGKAVVWENNKIDSCTWWKRCKQCMFHAPNKHAREETTCRERRSRDDVSKNPSSRYLHQIIDFVFLMENIAFALTGIFVKGIDPHFQHVCKTYLLAVIAATGIVGYSLKSAYYLFLHPWHEVQGVRKYSAALLVAPWGLALVAGLGCLLYYVTSTPSALAVYVACVILVFLFLCWYLYGQHCLRILCGSGSQGPNETEENERLNNREKNVSEL